MVNWFARSVAGITEKKKKKIDLNCGGQVGFCRRIKKKKDKAKGT